MPSLDDRFRALTTVRTPQDWPELDHGVPDPPREPHRRRAGLALLALAVAAAGLAFAVLAFQRPASRGANPGSSVAPTPSSGLTPEPTVSPVPPSPSPLPVVGVFGAIAHAIMAESPPGVRFFLESDRLDGDWTFDGNVDDGAGPGRLMVSVTVRPGMLQLHPCSDPEFARRAPCDEHRLANGDLLVLRDVLVDDAGLKTVEAVLIHPDGSGTAAEAGNFEMSFQAGPLSGSSRSPLQQSRIDPIYTAQRLGNLVRAVDGAARVCLAESC